MLAREGHAHGLIFVEIATLILSHTHRTNLVIRPFENARQADKDDILNTRSIRYKGWLIRDEI